MKIYSINVRTWTKNLNPFSKHFWIKRAFMLRNFIKNEQPDIILFQEYSCILNIFIPNNYIGHNTCNETAIFVKNNINTDDGILKKFNSLSDKENRYFQKITVHHNDKNLIIYNFHSYYNEKLYKQIEEINEDVIKNVYVNKFNAIVTGGFNAKQCLIDNYITNLITPQEQNDTMITFHGWNKNNYSKVDHFYTTFNYLNFKIHKNTYNMTDHYPISIDI